MRAKSTKTIFAIAKDALYVEVFECGIHPLIVWNGELGDLISFPHEGTKRQRETMYVPIEVAIGWHERELRETDGRAGSQIILDCLRSAKEKFLRGKIVENV